MPDPLPLLINEHPWSTITQAPGARHQLVHLGGRGGGELLDWVEETGHYEVWTGDPDCGPTGDPYPTSRTSGAWQTIRSGHVLIYLADTPGAFWEGNVLDWVPETMAVRIYRFDRGIVSGDPIPNRLNASSFSTIGTGHQLIYLDHDRVLDWEPATGRARVWNYDRTRTTTDPLPTLVTDCTWSTISTGHQLLYVGGDLLLDWNETNGDVFVWRYDRSLSGNVDPFPTLEMQDSWTGEIAAGRRLFYLGYDNVLDWDPQTGHERIWSFDRPMMPAARFTAMLNADLATAIGWVAAARGALTAYQLGLASGIHDPQWNLTDTALQTHFRAQSHPAGLQAALSKILETYDLVFNQLTTNAASITQISKQQFIAEAGGDRNEYTRAHTVPNSFTHLSPAYRPLDTIGNLRVDGAGERLRAAILIHEAVHFVADNPDSAVEWEAAYDTIPPDKTVTNPSTYATFAHHVLTNEDLRFGNQPWR